MRNATRRWRAGTGSHQTHSVHATAGVSRCVPCPICDVGYSRSEAWTAGAAEGGWAPTTTRTNTSQHPVGLLPQTTVIIVAGAAHSTAGLYIVYSSRGEVCFRPRYLGSKATTRLYLWSKSLSQYDTYAYAQEFASESVTVTWC